MLKTRKIILELSSSEAREFFLKHDSYCNFPLPSYFSFQELLTEISKTLGTRNINDITYSAKEIKNNSDLIKISDLDDTNHIIYANKDGNLSWRPFQLIHPVVYVELVHTITQANNWEKLQNRFQVFQANPKIKCVSIPVKSETRKSDGAEQISNWWENVEQEAIAYALQFNYLFDTDIADCYGSIYTHAIAWAIETKKEAKEKRTDKYLLGNMVDARIQYAQNGQTNGIPQGSVLMDFIAEIVLGYIDELLSEEIQKNLIENYKIIRYRDDYKIFVNSQNDGEKILKILSEIFLPFGFKLNSNKTRYSSDVITQSIKADKLSWLETPKQDDLQKQLLLIRQHSIKFPNSGSVEVALNKFTRQIDKEIEQITSYNSNIDNKISFALDLKYELNIKNIEPLVSITMEILIKNPRTIPVCCSILSKLLSLVEHEKKLELFELCIKKLDGMSNSGLAYIWFQRIKLSDYTYPRFENKEKLCELLCNYFNADLFLYKTNNSLWNNSWIKESEGRSLKKIIEDTPIISRQKYAELQSIISTKEIDLFSYQ